MCKNPKALNKLFCSAAGCLCDSLARNAQHVSGYLEISRIGIACCVAANVLGDSAPTLSLSGCGSGGWSGLQAGGIRAIGADERIPVGRLHAGWPHHPLAAHCIPHGRRECRLGAPVAPASTA